MRTITDALKQKSLNGQIKESDALAIAKRADELLASAFEMLTTCKKQVGMFIGGEISELQAKIKGEQFNEREYNYERLPDGQ
jgi:hypothetical protein